MSKNTDPDRWARLRFSVIGHLLAAPPERGELRAALLELADRTWSHPNDGTAVRFGFSTIERWYSAEVIVLRSESASNQSYSSSTPLPLRIIFTSYWSAVSSAIN